VHVLSLELYGAAVVTDFPVLRLSIVTGHSPGALAHRGDRGSGRHLRIVRPDGVPAPVGALVGLPARADAACHLDQAWARAIGSGAGEAERALADQTQRH